MPGSTRAILLEPKSAAANGILDCREQRCCRPAAPGPPPGPPQTFAPLPSRICPRSASAADTWVQEESVRFRTTIGYAQGKVYNTSKDSCMDLCQDTAWCHIAVSYPAGFGG